MNEVYAKHVGDTPPARVDGRGREAAERRARRDRSCRHRSSAEPRQCRREGGRGLRPLARASAPTSWAAPCATSCSASTRRTPTSSCPASTSTASAHALQPHGRTEELIVAGRAVGLRLCPRDRALRRAGAGRDRARPAAPGGLDRPRPPRLRDRRRPRRDGRGGSARAATSRSTRSPGGSTTDVLVDPFGGRGRPRAAASCARSRNGASPRIRCASCAACGSSRSSASILDEQTLAQMREEADSVRSSRASGSAAALRPTGWASCRSSCSGRSRRRRCGSRATRACSSRVLPEFGPAIGFDQESRYHDLTVDEHTFAVVQAAADAGACRSACGSRRSSTTSASRLVAWRGGDGRLHYYRKPGIATARARDSRRRAGRRRPAPPPLPERAAAARRLDRAAGTCSTSAAATRCARGGSCWRATATSWPIDLLDHKDADLRGKAADPSEPPPASS